MPRNGSGATLCSRNDIGCDGRKRNTDRDRRQKRRQRKNESEQKTEKDGKIDAQNRRKKNFSLFCNGLLYFYSLLFSYKI